ncbi:MAG TPA: hypothetical protein VM598_10595 [Bdellovibrionota bacterium]|nr:hypothetical protein [Bdellovibrionota bacterium]
MKIRNGATGFWVGMALFAASAAYAGQDVGNGGDLIMCTRSTNNPFEGTLALDYVLTYQRTPLAQVRSLEESLARIEKRLEEKVPGLLESFRKFRASLWNETDPTQNFMWTPVVSGLVNVRDEDIPSAERVPENCRRGLEIPLMQAVIRQDPVVSGSHTLVNHKYMKEKVLEVAAANPIQISFLLVHEWLWNLSDNVNRNRMVDRFLHSTEIDRMSQAEAERYLTSLGLKLPPYVPYLFGDPVCGESLEPGRSNYVEDKARRYAAVHGIPPGERIPLGTFHVRTVRRNCVNGVCDDWRESDYLASRLQVGRREQVAYLTVTDRGKLTLAGKAPSGEFVHAEANMDFYARFDFAYLLDPFDGKPIKIEDNPNQDVRMPGMTDGKCVHLIYRGRGADTGTKWVEWRYALFLWLPF